MIKKTKDVGTKGPAIKKFDGQLGTGNKAIRRVKNGTTTFKDK